MPLTKQQLLTPRYLCTGTPGKPLWHRSIFNHGDIIAMDDKGWYEVTNEHTGSHIFKNEYFTEYPHLFKPLPWWYGRTVEELPDYVKQTGMEDSAGNPVQDVVMKVKKHHSAGNGEWRDDSINIFCADSYLTGTPGSFTYAGWEPADESDYQEYQKQKQ